MCSALGYKAQRLQRVRIMNIHLGNLQPGQWRHLTPAELAGLADRGNRQALVRPQRGGRRRHPTTAVPQLMRQSGSSASIRQPAIKVPALIGPIRMAEQHAAGARLAR